MCVCVCVVTTPPKVVGVRPPRPTERTVLPDQDRLEAITDPPAWLGGRWLGTGAVQPDQTAALLAAKNRNAGFETAPPQGLFLDRVFYDQEPMLAYRRTTLPFMDGLA